MKTSIKIILYGLVAELFLTQTAILIAVKQQSAATIFCSGFCLLTVFTLTYLLLKQLDELRFTHYHIVCPPVEKHRQEAPVQPAKEYEANLLFRPTFIR